MFAIIEHSNSGKRYVHGIFQTQEEAELYIRHQVGSFGGVHEVVTFFPAIPQTIRTD